MEKSIEEELFSLNNIRNMEVIDMETGRRLGNIRDVIIDCDKYKIKSILLPQEKSSWFGKEEFLQISWNNIDKIGVDVILVHLDDNCNKESIQGENI